MKLRPLGDRVVLQYQEAEEKTQAGIILPDSAKEKPQIQLFRHWKHRSMRLPAPQPQPDMY